MILWLSIFLLSILGYAIWSLTNHKRLYHEAQHLAKEKTLQELQQEKASLTLTLNVFFVGGVLLTGAFAVQFFAGKDFHSAWTVEQYTYAGIGIIATIAITLIQRQMYSSIHQHNAALIITFLILSFVVFSELATSTERTDTLVKERSQESPIFQRVLDMVNQAPAASSTQPSPTLLQAQAELADAEYELGRCDRHASKGQQRVERCQVFEQKRIEQAQAKINTLQQAMQQQQQAAAQQQSALIDKAHALQYDETQQPAIIRFMQSLFTDADILHAMMLASLLFVVAYEAGFHFCGTRLAVVRYALSLANQANQDKQAAPTSSKKAASQYSQEDLKGAAFVGGYGMAANPAQNFNTGFAPQPEPVSHTTQRESLHRESPCTVHENGASKPDQDIQPDDSNKQGFIGFLNPEPQTANTKAQALKVQSKQLGTREQQLDLKPDFSAFRAGGGGWATPSRDDVTRVSPCTVHEGDTSDTGETADAAHRESPCTVHEGGASGLAFTDGHYGRLKAHLKAGKVQPTYRPVKALLKEWGIGSSDRERQAITKAAFERLHEQGVLALNPANQQAGIKKAKYVLA